MIGFFGFYPAGLGVLAKPNLLNVGGVKLVSNKPISFRLSSD
jgi:hypothetical protein